VALKVIQAGHGQPPGHRPLRGRAASPGHDGPPQHRPCVEAGTTTAAGPYSSWSWSKASPSPTTGDKNRLTNASAAGAVPVGLPGGTARPPEGDHPPRPQAVNIMVAVHDVAPVSEGDRLSASPSDRAAAQPTTLYTGAAQMIGTPQYMSPSSRPEQPGRGHAAANLFAGVLFYELLTGDPVREKDVTEGGLPTRCGGSFAKTSRAAEHARGNAGQGGAGHHLGVSGTRPEAEQVFGRAGLDRDEGAGEGPQPAL